MLFSRMSRGIGAGLPRSQTTKNYQRGVDLADCRVISKVSRAAILCLMVFSCLGVVFCDRGPALAASLQRLPDGRVIITALGQKLAFRENDAESVLFSWYNPPCDSGGENTLAQWLSDSKIASCLDRSIPDSSSASSGPLTFYLILKKDDAGHIYPGGLEYAESLKPLLNSWVVQGKLNALNRSETYCEHSIHIGPTRFGYEQGRLEGGTDTFELRASARTGNASQPLCVFCHKDNSSCAFGLSTSDGFASIGINWDQLDRQWPRPEWVEYDVALRKIAAAIFIDRIAGEFQ
jgi:hypothetical protein